jgi:hypothetical protein
VERDVVVEEHDSMRSTTMILIGGTKLAADVLGEKVGR